MNLTSLTLGEIVSTNYRSAAVFEKYNLDFCCHGNRNLAEACNVLNLSPEKIIQEIDGLTRHDNPFDFAQWPLDLLSDYIYKRHHHYVEQVTPTIKGLLDKVCIVHGQNHPELLQIQNIFNKTSGQLAVHMKKEELIVFPFIKKLAVAKAEGKKASSNLFNSVSSPIQKMEEEHADEGEQLQRMRVLSDDFTPPGDACTSYIATYKILKEYEADMHMHIHLENNILFPAAIKLENELLGSLYDC